MSMYIPTQCFQEKTKLFIQRFFKGKETGFPI